MKWIRATLACGWLFAAGEIARAVSSDLSGNRPRRVHVGANPESVVQNDKGQLFATLMGAQRGKEVLDGKVVVIAGDRVTAFAEGFADPKGIAWVEGRLIVADIDRIWAIDETGRKHLVAAPGNFPTTPRFLNDVAPEPARRGFLVSDTGPPERMIESPGKFWPLGNTAPLFARTGRIFRVAPAGNITELALDHPEFSAPNGIAVDPDGTVYIIDTFFGAIWRHQRDQWQCVARDFRGADGLASDLAGNLYISEFMSGRVWRLHLPSGQRTLLAELQSPADLILSADKRELVIPEMKAGNLVFLQLSGAGP